MWVVKMFLTRDIKSSWLSDKNGHAAKTVQTRSCRQRSSLELHRQIEGASDQSPTAAFVSMCSSSRSGFIISVSVSQLTHRR